MLGFEAQGAGYSGERSTTPDEAKKQRPSPEGSSSDWEMMLGSEQHATVAANLVHVLRLGKEAAPVRSTAAVHYVGGHVNAEAELHSHLHSVLLALHLLYEELKLSVYRSVLATAARYLFFLH